MGECLPLPDDTAGSKQGQSDSNMHFLGAFSPASITAFPSRAAVQAVVKAAVGQRVSSAPNVAQQPLYLWAQLFFPVLQ